MFAGVDRRFLARARSRTNLLTGASRTGQDERAWNHLLRALWLVRRTTPPLLRFARGEVFDTSAREAFDDARGFAELDRLMRFALVVAFLDVFFGIDPPNRLGLDY